LSRKKEIPNTADIYAGLRKFLEELLELSLGLAVKTEMLPNKYSSTNYANHKEVLNLLSESSKINRLIDTNPQFWHVLLDGKTKSELAVYKRVIRDINHSNQNWSLIQKNKEYFWALSEGTHWLLSLMNEKIQFDQPVNTSRQRSAF